MLTMFAATVATAGTADYLLASGTGADAGVSVLTQAGTACARSLVCWTVAVKLGIFRYYPSENGFATAPVATTLQPGQIITRYGSNTGQYASPIGTSVAARALPPDVDTSIISGFEVAKPIENVLTGAAKAWFGRPGGGVQYFFGAGRTLQSLVDGGYLTELP